MVDSPPFSLGGKTAIVTGGCGILGRKFAHALLFAGARVAVFDREVAHPERTAMEIQADVPSSECIGIACDVSSPESVRTAVELVRKRWRQIDILLNNAATKTDDLDAFFASFEEYDLKTWRQIMSVNIDGMFLMAQAVGRTMISDKAPGTIIQTASIYGPLGPDQRIYEGSSYLGRPINTPAAYATSKAAVCGLTRYLATYWGQQGIRVNTLVPGGVESGQNPEFVRRYSSRIPMGRMAKAEDLIGAVLFLASDASKYITGQEIFVDGGLSAW